MGGFGAGRRFRCGGFGFDDGGSGWGGTMGFFWMVGGLTERESSLCVGEIERFSLETEPEPILCNKKLFLQN